MAKLKVVSVYDSAMEAYMRPFYTPTEAMAIRSFSDEVNRKDENNPLSKHPTDYALHCLGEFDEDTGEFSKEGARPLARATDVIKE